MAQQQQQQGEEDNYAYEEEQERKALLQGLHGPMKQWYNGAEAAWCVRAAWIESQGWLAGVMCCWGG